MLLFPPIETADDSGLLAFGGDLEVDSIVSAYRQGIFPWPIDEKYPLAWFSPDPRGILFLEDMHLPQSFEKWRKKTTFTVKFNHNFHQIITHCANSPNRQQGNQTWIYPPIIEAYCALFKKGLAYCVGVYDNSTLVGGLYGVRIGKYITGESMFYLKTNASKLALYSLLTELITQEISWIDTQMVTPTLQSFGGKEIPRDHFINLLKKQIIL